MTRLFVVIVLPLVSLLSGCMAQYVMPRSDEPHAILKVRLSHHAAPEGARDEWIHIDGQSLPLPRHSARRDPHISTATHTRIRPTAHRFRLGTRYVVTRVQNVLESVTETYSCGTYSRPRTCTRSRLENRARTVEDVIARCEREVVFQPTPGRTYLMQFDFFGSDSCTLHFLEERRGAHGELEYSPVPRRQRSEEST